ncbi:MAG: response regulator transcription factor [Lachnospiraceae bacterium]|nr:response regulator transcription factor [Lachnospiraceae bacterium]
MRLLIIDDDEALCEALTIQLNSSGYDVDSCLSGEDALFYALQNSYDVILLDRMLPVIDGLTLLASIRKNKIHTPVIMMTAMTRIQDRIEGLDTGADDYITKPFDTQELMARIRALTRRPHAMDSLNILTFADLTLNTVRQELGTKKSTISLSKRETALFEYFFRNKNQTLSRNMLLSHIWGPDSEVEQGNLDNYIHFARKRLKSLKSRVQLKTVHGIGYRMEDGNVSSIS